MNVATVNTPVYLDNNASTPLDPRVVEGMVRVLRGDFGNPSSRLHAFGRRAADLVEDSRAKVARLLGADSREIVFTSGATESCNLAIKGVAEMYRRRGNHLVTCLAEHKAVLNSHRNLEARGFQVTWLAPDAEGRVSVRRVEDAITPETILVSIMAANSVVGTINPIADIGRVAKRLGLLFHCDATQAVGKIPIDVQAMGIDLLSLSAHKFHGPKGVGALYVRGESPKVRLAAQTDGGGHENGLRSGTLNVPGIVGLGLACEIAREKMEDDTRRIAMLRDHLFEGLATGLPGVLLNGHPRERLPGTLNVTIVGIESTELMQSLPDIAVSVDSACTSGTEAPHYVLRAMGLSEDRAAGSIRFSLGRFTTLEEIEYCIRRVVEAVGASRESASTSDRITCSSCPPGCCEEPGSTEFVHLGRSISAERFEDRSTTSPKRSLP
ncbi:MAG: cysteine desulfurase [Pirellulaceae bacterium]|nr:cysteine desulfurase [Pirellulaceae bacterium]